MTTHEERAFATAEAFRVPQVGDRFHEMFSYWMYVVAAEPGGRIATLGRGAPCTFPEDGRLEVYASHDAFREYYAYGSIPGYSIALADRGNDVTGWFTGWPSEPDPPAAVPEPEPAPAHVQEAARRAYYDAYPAVPHTLALDAAADAVWAIAKDAGGGS